MLAEDEIKEKRDVKGETLKPGERGFEDNQEKKTEENIYEPGVKG